MGAKRKRKEDRLIKRIERETESLHIKIRKLNKINRRKEGSMNNSLAEAARQAGAQVTEVTMQATLYCPCCEGSGLLYADGKTYYPNTNAPTVPCPRCSGTGYVKFDSKE